MKTRTSEQQSWRKSQGHKKCDRIEAIVDEFLAKHPSPDGYDVADRMLFPEGGATENDREWA